MTIKYGWKKKFGQFELRVRDILTAELTFEGTIYMMRRKYHPILMETVRGDTLDETRQRGLTKLRKILEHGTEQILSYTGGDV